MNDDYNAHDHLVTVNTKQGPRPYYPAGWRLYELNLRYPNPNFTSEIVHLDPERDFCVVKVRLFLGTDFEHAERKTESMKQGLLSQLDKLETAAKARCARDLGISTELALDIEEEAPEPRESLQAIMAECKHLGLASNSETWATWKQSILSKQVPNQRLTGEHLAMLREAIEAFKGEAA